MKHDLTSEAETLDPGQLLVNLLAQRLAALQRRAGNAGPFHVDPDEFVGILGTRLTAGDHAIGYLFALSGIQL